MEARNQIDERKILKDRQITTNHVFVADFETTSTPNLEIDGRVRVYIWSLVRVSDREKWYGYDIDSFLTRIQAVGCKICFFHNLKFDGNFILYRLLELKENFELCAPRSNWFYLSWKGIEFRDSLKKIKLSVAGIAIMLGIPHKIDVHDSNGKFPWDYYIPAGYIAPIDQVQYCIRDSEIVAEFISREWAEGRTRLTSSSEAFNNAKKQINKYSLTFPSLDQATDAYVRATYRGGVCAINPDRQGQEIEHLYNYDVNGLYGYVMQTALLPYGLPYYREPTDLKREFGFIDFFCEFHVKKHKFPMLQIKRNIQYVGRESEYLSDSNGITHLHLTTLDWKMMKEHYDIENDYGYQFCTFQARNDIFKEIIQKNIEEKAYWSDKAHYDSYKRTKAKDNTNMLYGSFGLNPNRDLVTPFINDRGTVEMRHDSEDGTARYIPVASAITASARAITIHAIDQNYGNWIYSDTDSMYLTKRARGLHVDDTESGAWKMEGPEPDQSFYYGKFLRQKCYVLADRDRRIYQHTDKYGNWSSKCVCAGMPDAVKQTVRYEDFKLGTEFHKLQHTLVKGGVCLMEHPYKLGEDLE